MAQGFGDGMVRSGDEAAPEHGAQPRLKTFSQALPVLLMRARESVMVRLRPILRDHDLTEQQWRVMRTLNEAGELEVTQLARRTFLLAPSLSRILRDLADRRLVRRRASGSDLRRGLVSLTAQGAGLIAKVAPEAALANAEIERVFGEPRMADLSRLLTELETVLGPVEGPGGGD